MIFAALGKLDLLTVIILMGAAILPSKLLLYASIYLIIKGGLFVLLSRDFASYGDLFSGFYLLILSYGIMVPYLHQLVFFWLLQKTILTFIAIGLKLFVFYYEYRKELPSFLR